MLHGGADPEAVAARAADWGRLGGLLAQAAGEMIRISGELEACWTGEAADAARVSVDKHARWFDQLGANAEKASGHTRLAGARLARAIEEMPPVDSGSPWDLLADGAAGARVGGPAGFLVGAVAGQWARAALREEQKQRAIAVMRAHESGSWDVEDRVGKNSPPPKPGWGTSGDTPFPRGEVDGFLGVLPFLRGQSGALPAPLEQVVPDAPVAEPPRPSGAAVAEVVPEVIAPSGTTGVSASAPSGVEARWHALTGATPAPQAQTPVQTGASATAVWQPPAARPASGGGARPAGGARSRGVVGGQPAPVLPGPATSVLGQAHGDARAAETRSPARPAAAPATPPMYGPFGSDAGASRQDREWRRKTPYDANPFGPEGLRVAPKVIGE
ncbi:PPE family protein [Actinosynnema pretiosum]|nr:PPE family protein [Actinosynnema pretiosum]